VLLIDPTRLNGLIGQQLLYQGIPCRVIEILDDGPALVLQDGEEHKVIQADQHGEARRRVPQVFTVAVLNSRRDGLNPLLPGLADLLR